MAYDAFILYANEISKLVRSLGYETILMWNDDVYRDFDTAWKGVAVLDPRIEIMYWSPLANAVRILRRYILKKDILSIIF